MTDHYAVNNRACISPRNTLLGRCEKHKKNETTIFKVSFFSPGKAHSSEVTIAYYGKKSFKLLNILNYKSWRVLIIEVKIQNEHLFINQSLQWKHGKSTT